MTTVAVTTGLSLIACCAFPLCVRASKTILQRRSWFIRALTLVSVATFAVFAAGVVVAARDTIGLIAALPAAAVGGEVGVALMAFQLWEYGLWDSIGRRLSAQHPDVWKHFENHPVLGRLFKRFGSR